MHFFTFLDSEVSRKEQRVVVPNSCAEKGILFHAVHQLCSAGRVDKIASTNVLFDVTGE